MDCENTGYDYMKKKAMIVFICISMILLAEMQAHLITHEFHSNDSVLKYNYYDCFWYYAPLHDSLDNAYMRYATLHQIIPFCIRPSDSSIDLSVLGDNTAFTFNELKQKSVTSDLLLEWSSSVQLAEDYEIYLNELNESLSKEFFYNCSSSWFGRRCQYSFPTDHDYSFSEFVRLVFRNRHIDPGGFLKFQTNTCYVLLSCNRGPYPACLDWREICNGKSDCLDTGEDEKPCFDLEVNECSQNEHRCRNGMQCIPYSFRADDYDNPDCMDGSDERNMFSANSHGIRGCTSDPRFRCEEYICAVGFQNDFVCGDGDCAGENGLCSTGRGNLMAESLSNSNNYEPDRCKLTILCLTWRRCPGGCLTVDDCSKFLLTSCGSFRVVYPGHPVLFGHVFFVFNKRSTPKLILDIFGRPDSIIILPELLCYSTELCGEIYPGTVEYLPASSCRPFDEELGRADNVTWLDLIERIKASFHKCSTMHDTSNSTHCRDPSLYRCLNTSKCISAHRINDGVHDCYYDDDESYTNSTFHPSNFLYHPAVFRNYSLYPALCDGYVDEIYVKIENETDESNCEWWPCNNIYTRCNQIWNCPNGIDEVNCPELPFCPLGEYPCVSPETYNLTCLSADKLGNGIVDCIGGTDERHICQPTNFIYSRATFQCWNTSKCLDISLVSSFDRKQDCPFNDDELVCKRTFPTDICDKSKNDSVGFVFRLSTPKYRLYFKVQHTINSKHHVSQPSNHPQPRLMFKEIFPFKRNCNRGLPILVYEKKSASREQCLCPPAYYGELCQYQSQRVSLSMQIIAQTSWRSVFAVVVILLDENQIIQSYEQIQYLSARDCDAKWNLYLLFLHRPKNISISSYSIQIHIYNKETLAYQASWLFPLEFAFLPVIRKAIQITIPTKPSRTCQSECHHGQCISFTNRTDFFCHCEKGWLGSTCAIPYQCDCSNDSICLGDPSALICVCLLRKFGRRCYLHRATCYSGLCEHDRECIETAENIARNNFTCICKYGYAGLTCNQTDTDIRIDFQNLSISSSFSSVRIDFLTAVERDWPIRLTSFQRIPTGQNFLTFKTSHRFNLFFLKYLDDFYFLFGQEKPQFVSNLSLTVTPLKRCLHIHELFNSTVLSWNSLRRMKLFSFVCQEREDLSCLYDDLFMCICNLDRFSNCFEFNHSLQHSCQGRNLCENGAECFQDKPSCPTAWLCACQGCFYGTQCEYSSEGFDLSLDAILGYQIRSDVSFTEQFPSVRLSAALVSLIVAVGAVICIYSILIFKSKQAQKVGCGIYLFLASINTLCIVVILPLKFLLLLFAQMNLIYNRTVLLAVCVSTDVILRILIIVSDWLSACVAIERTFSVYRGVSFNRRKSRSVSKRVIVLMNVLAILTSIHDPIHRRLIEDTNEQRTSCVVSYSSNLQIYNSSMLLFHFFTPFLLNIMSSFSIIVFVTRIRSAIQKQQTYRTQLRIQFYQHKHLLITPISLVLISLPRLILSLSSGCMKSVENLWLFLIGYFITFIPPILSILIFVLSSKTYKEKLTALLKRTRSLMCR